MTISIVIPTYTIHDNLEVMAYNCARSYREIADELIIVEDGGKRSGALLEIADIYIYHDENLGFTKNLNMGWKLASKDYTFLVNSDTYIESGDYHDLCIPGKVVSPFMAGHMRGEHFLNGAFFVVPKEVQKERGILNENYRTWYSDDDYYDRIQDLFLQQDSVVIRHVFGATIGQLSLEWRGKETEQDKQVYIQKWEDKNET